MMELLFCQTPKHPLTNRNTNITLLYVIKRVCNDDKCTKKSLYLLLLVFFKLHVLLNCCVLLCPSQSQRQDLDPYARHRCRNVDKADQTLIQCRHCINLDVYEHSGPITFFIFLIL